MWYCSRCWSYSAVVSVNVNSNYSGSEHFLWPDIYMMWVGRNFLVVKLLDYSPSFAVVGEVFFLETRFLSHGARGVLPYMGHIGMCRCEGYGFQAVYSSIGYINQSVWV